VPDIEAGATILIVGPKGCGKSTLASFIANGWDRVLVYDPKGALNAELPTATRRIGWQAAAAALPGRVIYQPGAGDMADLRGSFDRVVERAWRMRVSMGLVLHETADVAPSLGTPIYLSLWIRQGRRRDRPDGLAVHNPVIFVTQRPTNINLHALSEADHVYLFGLRTGADLSTMAGVMQADPRELRPQADRHAFYYRGPDGRVWAMPPLALGQPSEDAIQSVRQAR
jgi:hypothetical protein